MDNVLDVIAMTSCLVTLVCSISGKLVTAYHFRNVYWPSGFLCLIGLCTACTGVTAYEMKTKRMYMVTFLLCSCHVAGLSYIIFFDNSPERKEKIYIYDGDHIGTLTLGLADIGLYFTKKQI